MYETFSNLKPAKLSLIFLSDFTVINHAKNLFCLSRHLPHETSVIFFPDHPDMIHKTYNAYAQYQKEVPFLID